MKRLLLPLLAAIALPTAVNAESYWLVLVFKYELEKIEMKDMTQCEIQGNIWISSKKTRFKRPGVDVGYECLVGK